MYENKGYDEEAATISSLSSNVAGASDETHGNSNAKDSVYEPKHHH